MKHKCSNRIQYHEYPSTNDHGSYNIPDAPWLSRRNNCWHSGFSGQLKGWWNNYLTNDEKSRIYSAIKMDLNRKVITNDDNEGIPDTVNTLIFTIAQHFIPSLWKDRSAELLSNLKCRTLVDFRWYRDIFLTRVYTREDNQQPFWKEKFLASKISRR